jgi:hypothetical protein
MDHVERGRGLIMKAYLGNGEQALGNVNNTAEVLDAGDALLDSVGVVLASGVEDVLDLVGLVLGPLLVGRATVDGHSGVDGEQTQHDDRLLVDDVQLIADGGNGDTGTGREDGRLAQQAVAGQGVDDALGLLLGRRSRLVALETSLNGGHGGLGQGRDDGGRTRAGGACWGHGLVHDTRTRARAIGEGVPMTLRATREAIV